MSVKHLNILWVIVVFGMCVMPGWAAAKDAGVLLERAQVSSLESGAALQVEVTIRNQLSVSVNSVELGLECSGSPKFQKMGRRTMALEPGTSVSAFLVLAGPQGKPQNCSVQLLGYELHKPTDAVIKLLLGTGYSADERAALLSSIAGTSVPVDWKSWANQAFNGTPGVPDVLARLLSWYAMTHQGGDLMGASLNTQDLEKFDQPLQIILAARAQGTSFSSPIAFLLPEGVSTMKDALGVFQKREFVPAAALDEFQLESLKANQSAEPVEKSDFYRNLSLVLLTGIIIWALWGLRKKSRAGVSDDV